MVAAQSGNKRQRARARKQAKANDVSDVAAFPPLQGNGKKGRGAWEVLDGGGKRCRAEKGISGSAAPQQLKGKEECLS